MNYLQFPIHLIPANYDGFNLANIKPNSMALVSHAIFEACKIIFPYNKELANPHSLFEFQEGTKEYAEVLQAQDNLDRHIEEVMHLEQAGPCNIIEFFYGDDEIDMLRPEYVS